MTTNQRFQYGFDSSLRKPVHPPGSIIQSRIISFSRFSKHNVSLIDKLQIKLESRDILDCNRTREYQYTLRNNILGSVLSHCQFKPEQYRNSSIYGLLGSDMLQYVKSMYAERRKYIYIIEYLPILVSVNPTYQQLFQCCPAKSIQRPLNNIQLNVSLYQEGTDRIMPGANAKQPFNNHTNIYISTIDIFAILQHSIFICRTFCAFLYLV
ncbi:Hypothetical_protein [Hexamita inflata]|uniref:Hypothetical_protein n=1 Tax=Hexamita inflata TaxID=28002 RepID=A0AA86PNW2_9EUKA|nr:Hypothetical protein HINF_LOCUS31111 [Hexamita inflata]CAI9943469.1 Hypothetical protein HINF_LOCUS31114 [Hexamita inflata]CAI9968690.1 Hypothetical protein HINF_LOCUS56335 [Hexamita inflata]